MQTYPRHPLALAQSAITVDQLAPGRLRLAVATPLLIGYAATTIAVPTHLGLTHTVPVGARWWVREFRPRPGFVGAVSAEMRTQAAVLKFETLPP